MLFRAIIPVCFFFWSIEADAFHFSNDSLIYYAREFNDLYIRIRNTSIHPDTAQKEFHRIMRQIRRWYNDSLNNAQSDPFYFPIRGYSTEAIGGMNGSGFILGNYNYFDGVKSTGHPAHDIFIKDKNRDCLDDSTRHPVDVLSVSSGVVIATEQYWQFGSPLRGGLYVWVYNEKHQSIFYYAHNSRVLVRPGDIVKAGQKIAEVGRSGKNAFAYRSPTHLHFMQLSLAEENPKPKNPYYLLIKAVLSE